MRRLDCAPPESAHRSEGSSVDLARRRFTLPAPVLAGALVTLLYLPLVIIEFAFLDDYAYLASTVKGDNGLLELHLSLGRPISGWLTMAGFSIVDSLQALRWIRLASVIGIACVAGYITYLFALWGWRRYSAIAVGIVVASLPSFQVFASWAVLVAAPWAALSAMFGARLALSVPGSEGRSRRFWISGLASAALLASLLMYQPAAFMFVVVVLADVLNRPHSAVRPAKRVKAATLVAAPTLVVTYALFKWLSSAHGLTPSRSRLTSDVLGKVDWFLREPLARSLNLTQLSKSLAFAAAMSMLIAVGLFLHYRGSALRRASLSAVTLLAIPLAYLPNLLVAENFGSYRTQVALSSVLAILAVTSISELASAVGRRGLGGGVSVRQAVVVGLAIVASGSAAYNVVVDFAVPQNTELRIVWAQLSNAGAAQEVFFLKPQGSESPTQGFDSLAPIQRFDEFGIPSTTRDYVVEPMLFLLRRESEFSAVPIHVTIGTADGSGPPREMPVIDMTALGTYRLPWGH